MSIADKLTYLNGTKSLLREAINAAGGDLTQETTLREYAGGWLRDQSASLSLDFTKQQYVAKDKVSMFPDRVGFGDIVTFTRSTGGGRFNAQGEYEWVGPDEPRIDYDPLTGECLGLLIEEQRTNLLTYSNEFGNAVWIKGNVMIAPNTIIAPDGLVTADKLVESTSTSTHLIGASPSVTANTPYTASIFLKAGERTKVLVRFGKTGHPYTRIGVLVDLAAGTITASDVGTPTSVADRTIMHIGNGWYRVGVAGVFDTTSTDGRLQVDILDADGLAGYTGDGSSGIYIWGAQLEAGAFPTSYIPTTTAQVTRTADIANVNELSPWYNPETGTLFAESSATGVNPAANTTVSLTDGTTLNRIVVGQFFTSTRIGTVGVANVDQAVFQVPAVSLNQPHKFALAWASNNFAASVDGATPLTDSDGSIPTVTVMNIGSLHTVQRFCGHIHSIRYFPRKLPNSALQEITA